MRVRELQYLYLWTDVGFCANPISILRVVIYSPVENTIRGIQKYQTAIRRALKKFNYNILHV